MLTLLNRHLEYLEMQNYVQQTREYRALVVGELIDWLEERGLHRFSDVTKPILERYRRHLHHRRNRRGQPMSIYMQHSRLVQLRQFFKWLTQHNYILYNPASELELPRIPKTLPKHTLTADEAEIVMCQPDIGTPEGLRDRAILETFYSTGIRRSELVNLTRYDINTTYGTLAIRQGKGKKDRFVPIGDRALMWIDRYLNEARPLLVLSPDPQNLFIQSDGQPLVKDRVSHHVGKYIDRAKINKSGGCHLFRHTVATLMLENGADIRFIQQMLGHANLATTEIYTRVTIHKLKHIHTLTHPAKMKKDYPSIAQGDDKDREEEKEKEKNANLDAEMLLNVLAQEEEA